MWGWAMSAKQRGSWPKISQNQRRKLKKHFRFWKIGVCWRHHILNLRNENLLSTPERRCTRSAQRTWILVKWILWRAQCDQDKSFFWIVVTQRINIIFCKNTENELRSCHNRINWVYFVWMQDFWMLLRMDSISWRKTQTISHNFIQWFVVNTLSQEKTKHHNRKGGSRETQKWARIKSCNQLFAR